MKCPHCQYKLPKRAGIMAGDCPSCGYPLRNDAPKRAPDWIDFDMAEHEALLGGDLLLLALWLLEGLIYLIIGASPSWQGYSTSPEIYPLDIAYAVIGVMLAGLSVFVWFKLRRNKRSLKTLRWIYALDVAMGLYFTMYRMAVDLILFYGKHTLLESFFGSGAFVYILGFGALLTFHILYYKKRRVLFHEP